VFRCAVKVVPVLALKGICAGWMLYPWGKNPVIQRIGAWVASEPNPAEN
jgi:hypothetical protein